MANLRWDSCDAGCRCKQKAKARPYTGSVVYRDDAKEAIRTGALTIHRKVNLNFTTPDRRDNRDPQEIGEALLLERGAKGNGDNEISRPQSRPDPTVE